MLKPPELHPGDRVAAISLSWGGPGAIPMRYRAGVKQLEETFHLQVVETRHALKDPAWLEKNPQARAEDLMEAFADPDVRGIISTIGGEDSIRILPFIELGVLRDHPKVFMGFSDTTVTHLACFKAGLTSVYGPSIMAGFAENGGMFAYTVASIRKTLFSNEPVGVVEPNREGWTVERLDWAVPENQSRRRKLRPSTGWRFLQGQGVAQGQLIGGCLEVLDWLRGTPIWPDESAWQGAMLFLETSEDAPLPLAVTRFLRCLAAMGILQRSSAILFGRPGGEVPEEDFGQYDNAILKVVAEEQGLTRLPIVTGMDFGHTDPVFVLPYGVLAQVDCERQQFTILESAASSSA